MQSPCFPGSREAKDWPDSPPRRPDPQMTVPSCPTRSLRQKSCAANLPRSHIESLREDPASENRIQPSAALGSSITANV